MNEQDFDKLGKRLYDLEAEPPKDGWKKISPLVKAESTPFGWWRKHWWKPLLLILPAAIYFVYPNADVPNAEPNVTEVIAPVKEQSESIASPTVEATHAHDSINSKLTPIHKNEISTTQEIVNREEVGRANTSKREYNQSADMTTSAVTTTSNEANIVKQHNTVLIAHELKRDPLTENTVRSGGEQKPVNEQLSKTDEFAQKHNDTTVLHHSAKENSSVTFDSSAQVVSDLTKIPAPAIAAAATTITVLKDSIAQPEEKVRTAEKPVSADSAILNLNQEEKKSNDGSWRFTASVIPQYIMRSVRPVVNDEIWVTKIRNQSKPEQIGLGFALGVGKQVAPDFFIDAQLTYASIKQDIFFSYATGTVDTLIAVLQADQSVLVTPVFEERNREITSKYGYGGLRLSGTYYFWTTPKRRFNIMASAGANYLVSARVQEKINDQWVALPTDNLNTLNYSLVVGGGYNLNLKKGWELMINPSLTYYLREVKDQSLPYNLNQRSFGVMMMLSKTLRINRDEESTIN